MMYNKNADILLFLLLFTTGQREKNIGKTFVSAGAQKRWKNRGFGEYFTAIPTESQKYNSSKIYIYINYICLTFNWQKS